MLSMQEHRAAVTSSGGENEVPFPPFSWLRSVTVFAPDLRFSVSQWNWGFNVVFVI